MSVALGLTPSRTHRILETLCQVGLVEQDPQTRAYRLGYTLFELGTVVARQRGFTEIFHPYLEKLARLTGETAKLAVADRGALLYLDVVESNQSLRISLQIGTRAPLHCTAMGKALLTFGPPRLREQTLASRSFPRLTPQTITDPVELERELNRIRADGYSIDNEEFIEGSRGLAAPIRGHTGTAEAAISIAGPSVRLSLEKIRKLSPEVLALADKMSGRRRSIGDGAATSGRNSGGTL